MPPYTNTVYQRLTSRNVEELKISTFRLSVFCPLVEGIGVSLVSHLCVTDLAFWQSSCSDLGLKNPLLLPFCPLNFLILPILTINQENVTIKVTFTEFGILWIMPINHACDPLQCHFGDKWSWLCFKESIALQWRILWVYVCN